MTAPIASGWSDCPVGFSPTGKRRLCTAHANNGPLVRTTKCRSQQSKFDAFHALSAVDVNHTASRRHSITSSALTSRLGGIVRPSAFARAQVDHHLELCRLLDREISGPRTLENAIDIVGQTPLRFGKERHLRGTVYST